MDHAFLAPAGRSDLAAIDSLGNAALALDEQCCTLRWNQAFLRLFPEHDGHIAVGEPYAENLRRFYRARLDPREMAHIETYVADGVERHRRQITPYEFEHRGHWIRVEIVPLPAGVRLRLWTPASPPRDGETLAVRMVEAGKRVTDAAIDQLADGLILRDTDGRIILANRRIAETYGLATPAQAVGKTFPELLHLSWAGQAMAEEAYRRWADNSRFAGAPFELPLPADRWVRVREHRTHDGSLISTHVDVTDLFRLQRSANEARQRAEELSAMLSLEMQERKRAEAGMVQAARLVSLGQMATGLAHELNQPLAAMALAADTAMLLLRRHDAEAVPEAMKLLDSIATGSTRAREILDHLRSFGRQEEEQAPDLLNLNEVAERALILTGAAIRSIGIALRVSLAPGPAWVLGRAVALEQAVMNLLLNARDAIVERHVSGGAIHLQVERGEAEAWLTVSDNGGGFSAAAMQHALEPFFTTKETGKGTGLGLSFAYSTISAIGGHITLSNADGGAVIRIRLPLRMPPA